MKVIFLDIDGVVNSEDSWRRRGDSLYDDIPDEEHIKHLNTIVKETGAEIVISSSWRSVFTLLGLKYIMHGQGSIGKIIGKTPKIEHDTVRGMEIQKWLDDTNEEIESFVILDDDCDMAHLSDKLVKTTWETGLQEEHAMLAIEILNKGMDMDSKKPNGLIKEYSIIRYLDEVHGVFSIDDGKALCKNEKNYTFSIPMEDLKEKAEFIKQCKNPLEVEYEMFVVMPNL